MQINIFNGYQATHPYLIPFEQMVGIMRGDEHLAELTRQYRLTHEHKFKSQCYCFSVTCIFQGGKAKKDIVEVKDIALGDFDHVPKEKLPELCSKLKADKHVLFYQITVSGEGLRVLFRYEKKQGMTLEEQMKFYPIAFLHGNQYFSHLLGVEFDEHCSNLGRLMGGAYDPDAYYNPDAEPFAYDWLVAREQERKQQENASTRLRREVKKIGRLYDDLLAKELEREKKSYAVGSKNEYVSCLGYKLNAFGFSADAALEFIRQEFPDYERPKAAIDSCYRQTEEHGKRKQQMPKRSRESGKQASINEIIQFLADNVELRYNQITMRVEYKMKKQPAEAPQVKAPSDGATDEATATWQVITDRIVNTLWREMSKTNRASAQDFYRVIESDYVTAFNPFKAYLDRLPEWHDGDTDYIRQLADSITVKGGEEQQKLWELYLKKWLVGMLAGWTKDDVVNNVILVLIGEQGSGKSTWLGMVLPPALRQYFYNKTNANRLSKDDLLVLATYALVLCEELDTMKPAELNQLKAAVTMLSIDERAAYAHFAEHRPHIASFAATGNNVQFLSDPTGNRRWLPFEAESIRSPREHPFDYDHIYAQALHLLRSGFRYWFTQEEIIQLNRHNRQFEAPRLERELVSLYFAHPTEEQHGSFMTASRALQVIGSGISQKLSAVSVGRAFSELGFKKVRVSHCWGYLVIERDGDMIKELQRRLAMEAEDAQAASDIPPEADIDLPF